jgi:iron(III) transport system substrate-binding protein
MSSETLSRRRVLQGAGLAAASLLVPGSLRAQSFDDLLAAARKEGRGTFYTGTDPAVAKNLVSALKDKYGVDFDVLRLPSNTLAQRFIAEVQNNNPVADIVVSTERQFITRGIKEGWFGKPGGLPALKDWPASATNGPAVSVNYAPYSVTWNKNLVPDGIKSWQELAEPKWKGQLLMTDPRAVGPTLNAWYVVMRRTYGDEFLRKLGANASYSPSVVPGLQQVAAGAAAVYVPSAHQVHSELAARGAPIAEGFLQPTVTSDAQLVIAAKAPHPNLARLMYNFMITPEGQAIVNKGGFSVLPNVPDTMPVPKTEFVDPDEVERVTPEIIKLLGLS